MTEREPRAIVQVEDLPAAKARPGWVAVKEEYDAAVAAGTAQALELFIARHPDSEWTADARRRLAELGGG